MTYNIGELPQEEKDRVNVDLAASGVAYKERMNMPVVPVQVEDAQPAHLREYFRERLNHYREVSKRYPSGSDIVYQNMKENGK